MSQQFSNLMNQAVVLSDEYAKFQKNNNQKQWSAYDRTTGLVGDVGDLCKLVQAKYNLRKGPEDINNALAHELGDCLWSVMIIASMLDIDLEKSYIDTLEKLRAKISIEKENV